MPEPTFRTDEAFAHALDAADPLRAFREEFAIPTLGGVGARPTAETRGSSPAVYLTGNSLGAMPKRVPESKLTGARLMFCLDPRPFT